MQADSIAVSGGSVPTDTVGGLTSIISGGLSWDTFFGAAAGALVAFALERAVRRGEERRRKLELGNQALWILMWQIKALTDFSELYLNKHRGSPARWVQMSYGNSAALDFRLDLDSLLFLVDPNHRRRTLSERGQLLDRIKSGELAFLSLDIALRERNQQVVPQLHEMLESHFPNGAAREEDFQLVAGRRLHGMAVSLTDALYEHCAQALALKLYCFRELREQLIDLFRPRILLWRKPALVTFSQDTRAPRNLKLHPDDLALLKSVTSDAQPPSPQSAAGRQESPPQPPDPSRQ